MAYFSAAQYLGKAEGPAAYKEEIDNLAVLALTFENKSAIRSGLELGYRGEKYESVVAGKGAWILNMLRGITGVIPNSASSYSSTFTNTPGTKQAPLPSKNLPTNSMARNWRGFSRNGLTPSESPHFNRIM